MSFKPQVSFLPFCSTLGQTRKKFWVFTPLVLEGDPDHEIPALVQEIRFNSIFIFMSFGTLLLKKPQNFILLW